MLRPCFHQNEILPHQYDCSVARRMAVTGLKRRGAPAGMRGTLDALHGTASVGQPRGFLRVVPTQQQRNTL